MPKHRGSKDRVGDETLARIDDLQSGWKLPEPTEDGATVAGKRPGSANGPIGKPQRARTSPPPPPAQKLSGNSFSLPLPPVMSSGMEESVPTRLMSKDALSDPATNLMSIEELVDEKTHLISTQDVERGLYSPLSDTESGPLRRSPDPLGDTRNLGSRKLTEGSASEAPTTVSRLSELSADLPPYHAPSPRIALAPSVVLTPASVDVPESQGHGASSNGSLPEFVPRVGGVLGDLKYLLHVISLRRQNAVEMALVRNRLAVERESRDTKLIELARQVISNASCTDESVERGRAKVLAIEENYSSLRGKLAAMEKKTVAVQQQLKTDKERSAAEKNALIGKIGKAEQALKPLCEQAAQVRMRSSNVRRQLLEIESRARKGSAHGAALQAEVVSFRAEREAVAREEPALIAEMAVLAPQITQLNARLESYLERVTELASEGKVAALRTAETVAALKTAQIVEKRSIAELEKRKDKTLKMLGSAFCANEQVSSAFFSDGLQGQIETHSFEILRLERRPLELKELNSSVEVQPLIRGGLWLFAIVVLIVTILAMLV